MLAAVPPAHPTPLGEPKPESDRAADRAATSKPASRWEATDERRRHMARFARRDTAPELALRRELHARGRRFYVDRRISRDTRARPDIVFPRARVAVFVDGCFWHLCEEHTHLPKANAALWQAKLQANRRRDQHHDAVLRRGGWKVIRIWEHDDPATSADVIESALDLWAQITSCGHSRHATHLRKPLTAMDPSRKRGGR